MGKRCGRQSDRPPGRQTLGRQVSFSYRVFTRSSKRPALHLLEVCWTFAGSCKHPINSPGSGHVAVITFEWCEIIRIYNIPDTAVRDSPSATKVGHEIKYAMTIMMLTLKTLICAEAQCNRLQPMAAASAR